MPKRYWSILVIYIACQLSGFLLYIFPILNGIPKQQRAGVWIVTTFCITLVLIILILLPERHLRHNYRASVMTSIGWAIAGLFLLFAVQAVAGMLEYMLFGEARHSQNTQDILNLTKKSPYVILVVSIVGPIIEEIIFRKIIYGSIARKTNFWVGAIISSLLFALAHMDMHILVYMSVGFFLAFLYRKTGRIWVSMFAHAGMNTVVVLVSLLPYFSQSH